MRAGHIPQARRIAHQWVSSSNVTAVAPGQPVAHRFQAQRAVGVLGPALLRLGEGRVDDERGGCFHAYAMSDSVRNKTRKLVD